MIRLFAGLALPDGATAALENMQSGLPDARWIDSANMHLTLRFIGEVAEDEADGIYLALSSAISPGFELTLAGMDCFHSRDRVRAVWCAGQAGPELDGLRSRIESALVRTGLEPEGRKFKPHVTLARLRKTPIAKVSPFLELNGGFRTAPFQVDSFQLFQSHLSHSGARYEVIADYPLAVEPG